MRFNEWGFCCRGCWYNLHGGYTVIGEVTLGHAVNEFPVVVAEVQQLQCRVFVNGFVVVVLAQVLFLKNRTKKLVDWLQLLVNVHEALHGTIVHQWPIYLIPYERNQLQRQDLLLKATRGNLIDFCIGWCHPKNRSSHSDWCNSPIEKVVLSKNVTLDRAPLGVEGACLLVRAFIL